MSHSLDRSEPLGSMPLYVDLRRIYAELAAAGLGDQAALAPEQLFPFDQLHYHGTDAVRRAADLLGLSADSRVLEVGSGLGGPARDLAPTGGCQGPGGPPPRPPARAAVRGLGRPTARAGCRAGAPRRWPARPRDRPRRAA